MRIGRGDRFEKVRFRKSSWHSLRDGCELVMSERSLVKMIPGVLLELLYT